MLFSGVSASGLAEGIASRLALSKTKVRSSMLPSMLIETTMINTNYELFATPEELVALSAQNYDQRRTATATSTTSNENESESDSDSTSDTGSME